MQAFSGNNEQMSIKGNEHHNDLINLLFCKNMGYIIIKQNGRLWHTSTEAYIANPGKSGTRIEILIL